MGEEKNKITERGPRHPGEGRRNPACPSRFRDKKGLRNGTAPLHGRVLKGLAVTTFGCHEISRKERKINLVSTSLGLLVNRCNI